MLEPQPSFGPENAAYEAVVLPPKLLRHIIATKLQPGRNNKTPRMVRIVKRRTWFG